MERFDHATARPLDDTEACQALVGLIPELRRLARRLTRDGARADDLVQDTLLRVWAMMRQGGEIEALKPYVMQAARNLARRPPPAMMTLDDGPEPTVPSDAPRRMALRDVARGLAGLPAVEASAILRHAAHGESYAEIAKGEGVPLGTVMSRLARARMRLRADCGLPGRGPAAALMIGEEDT
ncbi:MAG: RNA polymerase sigma factor [Paracoccaceae bacterium]